MCSTYRKFATAYAPHVSISVFKSKKKTFIFREKIKNIKEKKTKKQCKNKTTKNKKQANYIQGKNLKKNKKKKETDSLAISLTHEERQKSEMIVLLLKNIKFNQKVWP